MSHRPPGGPPRAAAGLIVFAAIAAVFAGCGPEPCTDAPSPSSDAPALTAFELDHQLDGDPWTVIFRLAFTDADGDLSGGQARLYLNGASTGDGIPLVDLFWQYALPPDASSGELGLPVRFEDTVQDGAKVLVGMRLVDGEGHLGNCGSFEMDFAVHPVE